MHWVTIMLGPAFKCSLLLHLVMILLQCAIIRPLHVHALSFFSHGTNKMSQKHANYVIFESNRETGKYVN